jgi:hypothetical protein
VRGVLPVSLAVLCVSVVTACGGGGSGGGTQNRSGNAPGPTAPGPPPVAGDPDTLALPLSPLLLCGNGLIKRHGASTTGAFASITSTHGIDHVHAVDTALWTQQPAALEAVMRSAAVLAGDLSGDCWPDLLFVTGSAAADQLVAYDNLRGAGFAPRVLSLPASPNPIAAIALADLDADYRHDLLTGNLLADPTRVYRGSAGGAFELTQSIEMAASTFGFAFGDFAGDAWLDAYAAHWDASPPALPGPAALRNVGTDTFRPIASLVDADLETGATPADVAPGLEVAPGFTDLNFDGRLDLLIAADAGASEVLIESGSRFFTAQTDAVDLSALNASGAAIRDFDNDGHWDWFLASPHAPDDGRPWPWARDGNRFYWGRADSPYLETDASPTGAEDAGWPWGVCAQDFDNDGRVDLFVENGYGFAPGSVLAESGDHPFVAQIDQSLYDQQFAQARLFLNQGDRSFVETSAAWGIAPLTNGRGVACLDFDRDGDIDIAVAQNSGAPILYENLTSARDGSHFLSLRLLSVSPNTAAVGAIVELEAGGHVQMRQVTANSNFLGHDTYELHFGLGAAASVDRMTLQWPDGTTEVLTDIRADRFLALLDPSLVAYSDATRDARILAAITEATAYVAAHPDALTDDTLAFLAMMQRGYGLALPYAPSDEVEARIMALDFDGDFDRANALRAYRRVYDATYEIGDNEFSSLSGLDAITLASVYCHQFALTAGDVAAIAALLDSGGYDTTHALLALLFAIDNNCVLPASFDQTLIGDVVVAVHDIATGGAVTDLTIEATTFLAGAGRHDLIDAAWVDRFLDAQQPDGTFKADPGDAKSSGHTTGLALWLLLQLADPIKVHPGIIAQAWD